MIMPPIMRVDNSPGCLIGDLKSVVTTSKLDAEGLCKSISEVVRSSSLESLGVMHHALNRVCGLCSSKLLFVSLLRPYTTGIARIVLTELGVDVKHTHCFFEGLFRGLMKGVTFLPEELAVAQERTRVISSQRRTEHHWL
jgi:hypothetical protein